MVRIRTGDTMVVSYVLKVLSSNICILGTKFGERVFEFLTSLVKNNVDYVMLMVYNGFYE